MGKKSVIDMLTLPFASPGTITTTAIDTTQCTSATDSTMIPTEVFQLPGEERDKGIIDLLIGKHKPLQSVDNLNSIIHDLLKGSGKSALVQTGNNVFIFAANVNAGQIAGEVNADIVDVSTTWNAIKESIELDELRGELVQLAQAINTRACDEKHFIEVGNVGSAIHELSKANGPGMLQNLKKCGAWVLGVAKDIGVGITVELLKKYIENK